jgi:hypothetical protein
MARFEVQGIVSVEKGLPFVQCRQIDDNDHIVAQWQMTPLEAREMAQSVVEASMNAIYDASIVAWAKEVAPENEDMGSQLLILIRKFRADHWGLPDNPEDWR